MPGLSDLKFSTTPIANSPDNSDTPVDLTPLEDRLTALEQKPDFDDSGLKESIAAKADTTTVVTKNESQDQEIADLDAKLSAADASLDLRLSEAIVRITAEETESTNIASNLTTAIQQINGLALESQNRDTALSDLINALATLPWFVEASTDPDNSISTWVLWLKNELLANGDRSLSLSVRVPSLESSIEIFKTTIRPN